MSSVRPVRQWPLILCGPMLRRVTADEVCVFIALRQPAQVELLLFDDDAGSSAIPSPTPSTWPTLALGYRLHVVVARYVPAPALMASGARLHYDISITRLKGGNAVTDTLRSLTDEQLPPADGYDSDGPNLLEGPYALGGLPGRLPGFRVAASLAELAVLHGSCRKLHGEGPDMLALADDLRVDGPFGSLRPHQLILTGDQIYADDVALSLAQIVAATAPELITADPALRLPELDVVGGPGAYHGELPDAVAAQTDDPYGRAMNDPSLAPGARRAACVKDLAGFSVDRDVASGHLLYLGEFYAMYLLAWSPALWPVDADNEADSEAALGVDPAPLADDEDTRAALAEAAAAQDERLRTGHRLLPRVRRALANIPTLMMFDDHEVSDDWNLSRLTAQRVLDSRAGRQVVRNALAAYAVFQDWGNRPSAPLPAQAAPYAAGQPGAALLEALRCAPAPAGPLHPPSGLPPLLANSGTQARREVDDLFGLRPHIVPPPTMDWHWSARFPSHQVIALDTRTRRLLPDDGGPAGLIDPAHLATQLEAPRLAHPGLQALVVVAGPVFDLPPTELLKDGVSRAIRVVVGGANGTGWFEKLDRETWSGHRAALRALVEQLLPFGRVVLLSGDIHYAFTHQVAAAGAGVRARIVQLCASANRNEGFNTRVAIPAAMHTGDPARPLRMVLGDAPGFTEALRAALQNAIDDASTLGDVDPEVLDDLLGSRTRLDLAGATGVAPALPMADWAARPQTAAVGAVAVPGDPTRVLVHYLQAEEGADLRPCDGGWVPVLTGATPDPGWVGEHDAQVADDRWLLDHRQAVGINNIGLVRFAAADALSHTLYWFSRNPGGRLVRLWQTVHHAPLGAPGAGEV